MPSLRLAVSSLTCILTPSPGKVAKKPIEVDGPLRPDLFLTTDIPEWMQWDPYIKHGYRAQLNSFRRCFWSLFHLHNESVNTWSHILPGVYFLVILLAIDYWIAPLPFEVPLSDILAVQTYVAGTAGCLVFSATFHATNAHSPEVARAFLKLDYFGIVLTISTTCISVAYFALHGSPLYQSIYILFTLFCAAMVFSVLLDAGMDGARAGPWRATVFILLAASGFAPIFRVVFWAGEEPCGWSRIPGESLIVTCSSYALGTIVYITRFPEAYWPSRFDLVGASHQIFHVLVAFGQIVHLFGLREMLRRIHS